MGNVLIRLFVKNREQTQDKDVRTAYASLAGLVGIFCNILLFGVKLLIGIIINSISIMADAFNNLSDAGSSVIGLTGAKLAAKTPDKEHPFGHGRIEYLAALIVAFVILYVGVTLFRSSIGKILNPEKLGFSWVVLLLLGLSVLVKIWLSLFNGKLGSLINSNVLKATSTDARNDVVVTFVTIISVVFEKITGITIDGWAGIAVSIFVLVSGVKIAMETLKPLIGEPLDREIAQKIIEKVESYDGVLGTHDLIAHNYGPSHIMATIHAEVPTDADMEEIHEVIDRIERDVLREQGIFLVIHMDPVKVDDEMYQNGKVLVNRIIEKIEPEAAIHDFRILKSESQVEVYFDLVVPHSLNEREKEKLKEEISVQMSLTPPGYRCVITVESSFFPD